MTGLSTPTVCPRCGSPIQVGAQFCTSCGATLVPFLPGPQAPPPTMAYVPPPRPADFGNIFSDTLHLFIANWLQFILPYLLLAAITTGPLYAGLYLLGFYPVNLQPGATLGAGALYGLLLLFLIVILLALFVGTIIQGGVTYFAVERHRGHTVDLAAALEQGLKHFLSLVGASFLLFMIALALIAAPLILIIAGAVSRDFVLLGLGFLAVLVLIPLALYVYLGLGLYVPAIVAEGQHAVDSLRRSWDLMRGHRLSLFGALLVIAILGGVITAIITTPANLTRNVAVIAAANVIASAITSSWALIASAVAYDLIVSYRPPTPYFPPGPMTLPPPTTPPQWPPP